MNHSIPIFYIALFIFYPQAIIAQENEAKNTYEAFKKQTLERYEDFRNQCNAEYAEFMKLAWKKYKILPAIPRPKDETTPPIVFSQKDKEKERNATIISIDTIVSPVIQDKESQPLPVTPIYEQQNQNENMLTFTFFGTEGQVRIPKEKPKALIALNEIILSEKECADAWEAMSVGEYNNTIRDCLELRIRHKLCDWAYLLMLRQLSGQYCNGENNASTMLTAWLFCQSGYQMRLAMTKQKLYLLFGSQHQIFDLGYFNENGMKFYPLLHKKEKMEEQVLICGASFPKEQALSLGIPQAQQFAERMSAERKIQSSDVPQFTAKVQVNQNLLDFYNTYPTSIVDENVCSRWAMYANTQMAEDVNHVLYPQLRNLIMGYSEIESVNILLHWVQTGLVYEYDDKVWGHDRAFFAEETLYYPYCDCEDRAILFTRLVRDLLGLDCILIYYPGHLASAVYFTQQVNGDYISLNGRKFIVCDPTYIGAPVGMTMPSMDNVSAKVILLKK